MVRTWWLGPLVLTLTGGSAVLAQGPSERSSSGAVRERLMTITEQGKTSRRCRIIQTGTLPDGSRVYLVSAVDDGHRITVVQAPRKPDGSVSPTKFYHWSSEGKPPSAIASLVVQDDRPADTIALNETRSSETLVRNTQKQEVLPPVVVAAPRELRLPDLAPTPTLSPVKVEPSVVAIGSSAVVESHADKGPLAKGKAADAGTKGKAADACTKGKAADAGTKGKAADAGTKGKAADAGTKGKAADAGTKGKAADAGTKGKAADAGTKGKAADAGTKGKGDDCAPGFLERLKGSLAGLKLGKHCDATKAADAGTKGKAADAGTKGKAADAGTKGKAADAGTKGKAADAGTKGKAADAGGTKGKAADAGTKGAKVDATGLPHSRVAEGDPLTSPMDFQKPIKEKAEAGASLLDKLRKTLGLADGSTNHAAESSHRERGSNREQPGRRSMEAAGIAGQFGVGEGFPIMLGGQPANPPSFQDLPKPPYAPNLPGPESNPYVASPDRGVSPGAANAFTATSTTRPIPADFGALPVKQNAFSPQAVPGPAPVQRVNLPLPGMNPPLSPEQLGMPHQATPLQSLPGNAPAVLNLGKKKTRVDDDGLSNAFTEAPQVAALPTLAVPVAPATLQTTAATVTKVNLDQPIRQLRESLLPSEREMAIEALAESDLRQQNEAATALLTAAFRDPAVTVRLCAIRTLALKLGHNPQVIGALRTLKEDGDARIRAEAQSALHQTGTTLPTPPSMPRPAAPRAFPVGG